MTVSNIKTFSVTSEAIKDGLNVTPVEKTVYTAIPGGCLIQNVQLYNKGNLDTTATILCYDAENDLYRAINFALAPKKSYFALEDYAVMEVGHTLTVSAESNDVEVTLSVTENVEIDEE